MDTKRKPEDVVLDDEAVRRAERAFWDFTGGTEESLPVFLRTYIAEVDLIPRPQTVEEWVKQMPESVWEKVSPIYTHLECFPAADGSFLATPVATIPRPKPPRMTDEEIEHLAIETAKNTALGDSKATVEDRAFAIGIYRQTRDELLAERAKLEKERGDDA